MKTSFLRLFSFDFLVLSLILVGFVQPQGYGIGDKADDFELKNIDGKTVSMADYSDAKGFIVVFTCNTCPYAKMYEQRIIELHEEYVDKGFPVLAIQPNDAQKSPGDSFAEMKSLAKKKDYPFPYLLDDTQEIAKAFGATKTPHVFVLDKDKKVSFIGAIDNNPQDADAANTHYVKDAVNALLEGKEVSKTSAKAVGCTIKWKS